MTEVAFKETNMTKPEPYVETKSVMNFIDMQRWIDEKYGINARDYSNKFGFKWHDHVVSHGVEMGRAMELYSKGNAADPTEAETVAMASARDAQKAYYEEHPYQDFWHFQLELFDGFSNDSYQTLNLKYQLSRCKEAWQLEIAQMWQNEFGAFADEEGDIELWVSW